jgi:putative sterol carrier protein
VALRYLSGDWLTEARARLEGSKDFLASVKEIELAMVNVVNEAPGGTLYIRYVFKAGKVEAFEYGKDAKIAAKPVDFKVTGVYETFASLNQGKMTIAQAFLGRKIQLDGSVTRAMKFVKPFDAMNKVLRQIPTVY